MRATSSRVDTVSPTSEDEQAARLIAAFAACPPDHPNRPDLRDQTITAWSPMAERLARRYAHRGEPIEDLRQTAMIGLIKAVDRFQPELGTEFVPYALPTIVGEIRRYFRDRAWSVRVPRRLQESWMAINAANRACQAQLGRTPTIADLAAYLHVSEDDIIEGLEGARAYRATSLSAPVSNDGTMELGDTLGSVEHGYALTELQIDLGPALAALTDRERQIVMLRFYGNQTQTQIALQVGVSQMHVSRLLAGSLTKLRKYMAS
jgi:RNA polymerase sigma-B factor